jgi:hypothetical protein
MRLVLAAILMAPVACTSATAPENELAAARQLWADRKPASYGFMLARHCGECLPEMVGPVLIKVENGTIVSREYVQTGAPVQSTFADAFPSIDGVFDIVEEAISRDAYRLEVSYHRTLGYPVNIAIDYDEHMVDDEFGVSLSDLNFD